MKAAGGIETAIKGERNIRPLPEADGMKKKIIAGAVLVLLMVLMPLAALGGAPASAGSLSPAESAGGEPPSSGGS